MFAINDYSKEERKCWAVCMICMNEYDDVRLMDCSHSFCLKCVQNVENKCPLCHYEIEGEAEELIPNFAIKTWLTLAPPPLPSEVEVAQEIQTCEGCGDKKSEYFCANCDLLLCGDCSNSIHQLKLMKMHEISELSAHLSSIKNFAKCDKHVEEEKKFYCETCNKFLCAICGIDEHYEHHPISVYKLAENTRGKWRSTVESQISQIESKNSWKSRTDSLHNKIDKLATEISFLQTKIDNLNTKKLRYHRDMENIAHLQQQFHCTNQFLFHFIQTVALPIVLNNATSSKRNTNESSENLLTLTNSNSSHNFNSLRNLKNNVNKGKINEFFEEKNVKKIYSSFIPKKSRSTRKSPRNSTLPLPSHNPAFKTIANLIYNENVDQDMINKNNNDQIKKNPNAGKTPPKPPPKPLYRLPSVFNTNPNPNPNSNFDLHLDLESALLSNVHSNDFPDPILSSDNKNNDNINNEDEEINNGEKEIKEIQETKGEEKVEKEEEEKDEKEISQVDQNENDQKNEDISPDQNKNEKKERKKKDKKENKNEKKDKKVKLTRHKSEYKKGHKRNKSTDKIDIVEKSPRSENTRRGRSVSFSDQNTQRDEISISDPDPSTIINNIKNDNKEIKENNVNKENNFSEFVKKIQWTKTFGSLGNSNEQFHRPCYIAANSNANLIAVSDSNNHRVQLFDQKMNFLFGIGSKGSSPGQFLFPRGISINSKSNLIIVADQTNHRIQFFNLKGEFLFQMGKEGKDCSEFKNPQGVAISNSLNLIAICDCSNKRIQLFSLEGKFLFQILCNFSPYSIDINKKLNIIVVTDPQNDKIHIFTLQGRMQNSIGGMGSNTGKFINPAGVAIYEKASLIGVSDYGNNRLQFFNLEGEFQFEFGKSDHLFNQPFGVAIDKNSNTLIVSEDASSRLQLFLLPTSL